MYCPDCGHNNPEGNRFCGMCGERLPERTNRNNAGADRLSASEKSQDRRERIADHDPEPVAASLRHREAIDEPVRELPGTGLSPVRQSSPKAASAGRYDSEPISKPARVVEPAAAVYAATPHLESASPIEQPATTLSGPSFLGLSSGSNGSDSYSYLYEDEAPRSHAGFLAFLLLLVIAGGVVYWQWQPIQNWVINRANQKVDTGTPAPTAGSSTASSDNTSTPPAQSQTQPATTNPSGDNSTTTPATTAPTKQPSATPGNSAAPKNAEPADKPKSDDSGSPDKQEESDSAAGLSKASSRKAEAKTSAAAKRPEPEPPAGADLVASGEKYLYGRGTPQNCRQAIHDFNAAAQQENARAMAHLGALYATGECVPLNRVQAYQWFSRALAKDRSNTYLEHNMSMLWREMDTNEKAQVSGKSPTEQSRMF